MWNWRTSEELIKEAYTYLFIWVRHFEKGTFLHMPSLNHIVLAEIKDILKVY